MRRSSGKSDTGQGAATNALSRRTARSDGEETAATGPNLEHEGIWSERGFVPIAGIDEAGRGPWAGPVVAAAVVLDLQRIPSGINDSKALNSSQRDRLFDKIMTHAEVGIGIADVDRIDRDNILRANFWAMTQAVSDLPRAPKVALVDGNRAPSLACAVETIVKGDARSLSIAAASIIAKVTRDRIMIGLASAHPGYGWERNMGYGVPEHRAGIDRLGLTPHHRRSFRPVALAARLAAGGQLENEVVDKPRSEARGR